MSVMICYHGSPGTPNDFRQIETLLPNTTFLAFDRYLESPPQKHRAFRLGYSWGCVPCLRDAAHAPEEVAGVALISPYLFPSQRMGLMKRTLLKTPGLGPLLLKKAARTAIFEMLRKTSSPCDVPESYLKSADELMDPQRLGAALFEKESREASVSEALHVLADAGVPVAVIYGAEDKTSLESEQIEPLRQALPQLFERRVERAGHALPWTHPQEVADFIRDFSKSSKRSHSS